MHETNPRNNPYCVAYCSTIIYCCERWQTCNNKPPVATGGGQKTIPHIPEEGSIALQFGIYDPKTELSTSSAFEIEQIFISWIDYDKSDLRAGLQNINQRNRIPFVTIEQWPRALKKETLLADITGG